MRVEPDSAPYQGHPRAGSQAIGLAMAFKQVYCVHRLVHVSASQCQHRSPGSPPSGCVHGNGALGAWHAAVEGDHTGVGLLTSRASTLHRLARRGLARDDGRAKQAEDGSVTHQSQSDIRRYVVSSSS